MLEILLRAPILKCEMEKKDKKTPRPRARDEKEEGEKDEEGIWWWCTFKTLSKHGFSPKKGEKLESVRGFRARERRPALENLRSFVAGLVVHFSSVREGI